MSDFEAFEFLISAIYERQNKWVLCKHVAAHIHIRWFLGLAMTAKSSFTTQVHQVSANARRWIPASMNPPAIALRYFRIDVIEIPVANPALSRIVSSPAVFADDDTGALAGLWRGGDHGDDTQDTRPTDECHDITVFPAANIAAGACSGKRYLVRYLRSS